MRDSQDKRLYRKYCLSWSCLSYNSPSRSLAYCLSLFFFSLAYPLIHYHLLSLPLSSLSFSLILSLSLYPLTNLLTLSAIHPLPLTLTHTDTLSLFLFIFPFPPNNISSVSFKILTSWIVFLFGLLKCSGYRIRREYCVVDSFWRTDCKNYLYTILQKDFYVCLN